MRIDRLDLIAYGPFTDKSLDLSDVRYEVKKINQSSGGNLTEILDNYSYVIIDDIFEDLTISYDPSSLFLNEFGYVIISRIPNHYELQNDTC